MLSGVGPRKHLLDGVSHPLHAQGHFWGERDGPLWSIETFCRELWKNGWTDQDQFGEWTRVGPRKHVLDHGSAHWRHPANTTEKSMCGGDAAFFVKLFWPLVRISVWFCWRLYSLKFCCPLLLKLISYRWLINFLFCLHQSSLCLQDINKLLLLMYLIY